MENKQMAGGVRASSLCCLRIQFPPIFAARGPFILSEQRVHRGESAVLSVFAQCRALLTLPIFLRR